MPWVFWRTEIASAAEVSIVLSILTVITLLPSAVESFSRDVEEASEVFRTPAITMVLGRWRRDSVNPLPKPTMQPSAHTFKRVTIKLTSIGAGDEIYLGRRHCYLFFETVRICGDTRSEKFYLWET